MHQCVILCWLSKHEWSGVRFPNSERKHIRTSTRYQSYCERKNWSRTEGRRAAPFGAEGGLRQRDVRAERVEHVGGHARSLGAALWEGPAGGAVKGGVGRRRSRPDGHGVAEDLREHVGRRRRGRRPGPRRGRGELLREAAGGELGLLEEVGPLLGGEAPGEKAHRQGRGRPQASGVVRAQGNLIEQVVCGAVVCRKVGGGEFLCRRPFISSDVDGSVATWVNDPRLLHHLCFILKKKICVLSWFVRRK